MADRRPVAWRRHLRTLALLVLVLAGMRWCVLAALSTQVEGTVVDSQTGQPVPGAIVVAHRWSARLFGGKYRRAQIAETRTDSAGRFHLLLESRSFSYRYVYLSGYEDFIVVAQGYEPVVAESSLWYETHAWPKQSAREPPVVRLKPLGRPATVAELEVVARQIGGIYAYLPLVCKEVEVPMLVRYLRDAKALAPEGAIDKRKWDDRRDCVN